MVRWFDEKLERNRLRGYTKRRLSPGFFRGISRRISVVNWLILINLTIFLIVYLLVILGFSDFVGLIELQPAAFFSGSLWQILTHMFVHLTLWHLLANMISLFFIGNFVEKIIGRKRIFWFYLAAGIFAGLFHSSLSYFFGVPVSGFEEAGSLTFGSFEWLRFGLFGSSLIYAVGASGAVFGLLGLLSILTPKNRVYLIAGPLIALIVQAVLATVGTRFFPVLKELIPIIDFFIYIYLIFSIIAIFSFNPKIIRLAIPLEMPFWILPFVAILPLIVIGLFVTLPIGNMAHLGGLIFGMLYGLYLKKRYKRKTAMISRYFS
jgi:membrane associated rhomboid family serine protease